ncbi:hypothetical protein MtrunA17_Chr5g0399531 [Medicago truncatula]|uniref:Transmembrane protein n=1 Tax=Medicago truncatula TaxID=3880 RepID=A0A396HMH4_MEDTR|nr:hypothetical protein MtrunA17_Chr5g0399531 [Medicago truncatula]
MNGGDVVFVKKLKTRKGGIILLLLLLLTLYVKWIVNARTRNIIAVNRGLEDESQEEGEKEE